MGNGSATFYYLPDSIFGGPGMGTTDAARAARVVASTAFGPHSGPTTVQVLVGRPYVFLPMCNERIDPSRKKPGQVLDPEQPVTVTLTCPM
jgi:hypothetical protein